MSKRRCPACGEWFTPKSPRARCCSTRCRVRDWKRRTDYDRRNGRNGTLAVKPKRKRKPEVRYSQTRARSAALEAVYTVLWRIAVNGAVTREEAKAIVERCLRDELSPAARKSLQHKEAG